MHAVGACGGSVQAEDASALVLAGLFLGYLLFDLAIVGTILVRESGPRERCAARRACGQRERPPRAPRVGMALRGTQTLRGARRALLGRARGVRPG